MRNNKKETKSDILSCKRSLEEKENEKGNEHYVDNWSIDKLCTKNVNGNNKDASLILVEVHIILDKNVDILPLRMKRPTKDNGNLYIISKNIFWL